MKQTILAAIRLMVARFLHGEQPPDRAFPDGGVQAALRTDNITIDEMVDQFKSELMCLMACPDCGEFDSTIDETGHCPQDH